jgi:hypothetical protein
MAVTRQSLLDEIRATIDQQNAYSTDYSRNPFGQGSGAIQAAAMGQETKRKSLSDLLRQGDAYGWGEVSSGAGGVGGGNAFGGAPTMSTSNRFEAGLTDAETRLRSLLDNPDSVQQSAAYKFRVGQGQEALQRSLGAKGLLNSGNRLMELTKYGQDMGSQEYENQFGRLGNLLSNYSTGWVGDKNANTSAYSAQSNAWNTAQANADRNRYQMGMLDVERNKPVSVGGGSRSSSSTPSYVNAGGFVNNVKYPLSPWDSIYNNPAYGPKGEY